MLKKRLLLGSPFPVAALALAVATPGLREQVLSRLRQSRTSSSDPMAKNRVAHLDIGVSEQGCVSRTTGDVELVEDQPPPQRETSTSIRWR